jgi:Ankyrin repeats (many copies)
MLSLHDEGDIEINAKNVFEDGWTCLHYAIHEGYFEVV